MATRIYIASFGPGQSGLSTVGYTILSSAGATIVARSIVGVSELSAGTGTYAVTATYPDATVGYIQWDTGGGSPKYLHEDINPSGGGSVDANALAVAVWSAATRTLTSTGTLPQIIVAGEVVGGETMNLIQRSARNYVCTIPGIPVGATVVKAYFAIKNELTDLDEDALLMKTITPTLTASGQITDTGALTQTAVVDFTIDNDDLDTLPLDTVMKSAVKVVLSTGAVYTPPLLFRPVVVWPWGVYTIS